MPHRVDSLSFPSKRGNRPMLYLLATFATATFIHLVFNNSIHDSGRSGSLNNKLSFHGTAVSHPTCELGDFSEGYDLSKKEGDQGWLGFEIQERDWELTPLARAFWTFQQLVYNQCPSSLTDDGKTLKSEARTQEISHGFHWNCTDHSTVNPKPAYNKDYLYDRPQPRKDVLTHLSFETIQWYGKDAIDFMIYATFFPHQRDGVFMEVGAVDGLDDSNTLFFEEQLGWTGKLFEPTDCYHRLKINRPRSTAINGALCETEGLFKAVSFGKCHVISNVDISCKPLLSWAPDVTTYDFMSIDVEGAELEVLKTIDFEKIKVKVLLVEWRPKDQFERRVYLESFGFRCFSVHGFKRPAEVQWGGDELCWNPKLIQPDCHILHAVEKAGGSFDQFHHGWQQGAPK